MGSCVLEMEVVEGICISGIMCTYVLVCVVGSAAAHEWVCVFLCDWSIKRRDGGGPWVKKLFSISFTYVVALLIFFRK